MADKNKPKSSSQDGVLDYFTNWWSQKPSAPTPYRVNGRPVVNQPLNRKTLNRSAPAPYLSLTEGAVNFAKNIRPLEFTRDTLKGLYKAGKTLITDPKAIVSGLGSAANGYAQMIAAMNFEQTGDKKELERFARFFAPLGKADDWQKNAIANYRMLASNFTYVDKNGERKYDSAALARNLTQRPMETLSLISPVGELTGARLAASTVRPVSIAGNVLRQGSRAVNIATNPTPFIIAQGVSSRPVQAGVDYLGRKAGIRPRIFDRFGEFTDKVKDAFKAAGIDPNSFDTPEMRQHLQTVVNELGVSPASIRHAALRAEGISPTRSMTTGERPMAGNVTTEAEQRRMAAQQLAENMEANVSSAYQQAASHQGVFTNTADFSAGVRQSVENELQKMGLTLDDVQGNVRFKESQKALQGNKNFPGVFDQFDELSGAKAPTTLVANDLNGIPHTYDYNKRQWLDPSGQPVTATGKVQFLDLTSNRPNVPPPTGGANNLTPQSIDSVRRNVNSFFPKAVGDDAAVLGAINRGIDNYVVDNAANFTGDGLAMARDWANARKTSQLAMGYGSAPDLHPFAPRPDVKPFDPNAVARTETAKDIVSTPAMLPNTAVPTIWDRIKGYVPTVGTAGTLGYMAGVSTGIPGAGMAASAASATAAGALRNRIEAAAAQRAMEAEFAGAPRSPLWTAPNVRIPTSIAGSIATAAQADHPTAFEPEPRPQAPAPAPSTPAPPKEISYEEYQRSLGTQPESKVAPPPEISYEEYQRSLQSPQPQYRGGRAAYNTGGAVGSIEPLVRNLVNKAGMVKKMSNKTTEPLLNEHDDAIATALEAAQKAI